MARNENRSFNRNVQNASREVVGNSPVQRKCHSYGPHFVDTWAETELEQETFAFLWSVKDYSRLNGTEELKSPIFRGGGPKSNHSWQLKMCPKKMTEELEYFSVHLILTSFGDDDATQSRRIKAKFQISLLGADGRPGKQAGSASMNPCEFRKLSIWGYDKFILSTDLISSTRRLVEDDSLQIHCRVWIDGDIKHQVHSGGVAKKSEPEEEKAKRRKEKLANDFGMLFKDNVITDIAVTTESSTFMAHKAVLAARSSVFAAMFNTSMVEREMNTVVISDFEDDIVKAMLEYLYTGETELLHEQAPDLLQIAEKYDLPGLKEDCEYVIADNLTVEIAAQVLTLAHLYNANLLKPRVIDYINSNKEDVKKTKPFQEMTQAHPNVLVDLYLSQKD